MAKLQLIRPTHVPYVNQGFGVCVAGSSACALYKKLGMLGHNGIDYNALDGEFVYATHDGEVVFAGEDGSNGQLVVIRTLDKFDYKDDQSFYKTLYGHLQKGSIRVKAGQKVAQGEYIAQADNTGDSYGSHLHFGLKPVYPGEKEWEWWNWEQSNGYFGAVNPEPYFTGNLNSYKASDYIALAGSKKARVLEIKQAQQLFALANVVAGFGA